MDGTMEAMSPAAYNHGWETEWDDMKKYGPFSRHLRRLLMETLQPLAFTSVLDVGCGQGALLTDLQAAFPHIQAHGTDVSTSAVNLAQARVSGGRFWVLDATQEHLDKKFDLVVCSDVLEHIQDDTAVLHNLAQMTGKYLLIATVQGRMRPSEVKVGHVRNYAYGELVQKVEHSGLAVLQVIEWGFPFYSPLYRNVLEMTDAKGTTGEFGLSRKLLSQLLYGLFQLNSSKRGDEILVLAQSH